MADDGRLMVLGSLLITLGLRNVVEGSRLLVKKHKPWITRPGKLGGPGYAEWDEDERHGLLSACVQSYGYRSCLSSLTVLLKPKPGPSRTVRAVLARDIAWLKKHRGDLEAGVVSEAMFSRA